MMCDILALRNTLPFDLKSLVSVMHMTHNLETGDGFLSMCHSIWHYLFYWCSSEQCFIWYQCVMHIAYYWYQSRYPGLTHGTGNFVLII